MMAMSSRPAFSPPAGCGMHFLKKPATTMASYTGLVARNRSSAVGSNSAALAPASTSTAKRRDSSWSSRCGGISVKSMAMETFPEFDRSCLFRKPLWDRSRKVSDAGARFLGLWRTRRIQTVVATPILLTYRNHASSASAGVFQPSVFRGLALRVAATAAISSALCTLRSVPFGKY